MKFDFIEAEKAKHSIPKLCRCFVCHAVATTRRDDVTHRCERSKTHASQRSLSRHIDSAGAATAARASPLSCESKARGSVVVESLA